MKKLARYFSFQGRTSRLGYWRTQVWLSLVWAVIWCAGLWLTEATGIKVFGIAAMVSVIPYCWLLLAMLFRRLHDRNKSGWWAVPFCFAPLVLAGVARGLSEAGGHDAMALVALVALVELGLALWALVELGFVKGTRGNNRFGPDPYAA